MLSVIPSPVSLALVTKAVWSSAIAALPHEARSTRVPVEHGSTFLYRTKRAAPGGAGHGRSAADARAHALKHASRRPSPERVSARSIECSHGLSRLVDFHP
jgi:hypothetical protein